MRRPKFEKLKVFFIIIKIYIKNNERGRDSSVTFSCIFVVTILVYLP